MEFERFDGLVVDLGLFQLAGRESLDVEHVGPLEDSAHQFRPLQFGPRETRTLQVCLRQVRPLQVAALQLSMLLCSFAPRCSARSSCSSFSPSSGPREFYFLNVVRIVRLVTPIMIEQQSGSIVNISTYAAFEPEALFPTSGVFRSALAAYTKLYSDRYAADNIRINNILPGFIDSLPEAEERRSRIPMGRYGRSGEVADLIAFLASHQSSYITGQNIRIDGGITRSV